MDISLSETHRNRFSLALFFRRAFPVLLFLFLSFACKYNQEILEPNPAGGLAFSDDTLFFDTVFTDQKTITFRLRIYNTNEKAININSASVSGFEGYYPFGFYINGRFGPTRVENIFLEGKDSAYVLVSARIDQKNQNLPYIVKDSITFEIQGRSEKQKVLLLAYGQDANYLRNTAVECNTTWNNSRPYILVDTVSVAPNCTLTIQEGTRIYGYNSAFLIVRGVLIIEGEAGKEVVFQGTRQEEYYSTIPGQWGGILIMDGGLAEISFARIKNSFRGIQVGQVGLLQGGASEPAFLFLRNSRLENIVDYGILGVKSRICAVNNHFADCGESSFAVLQGGQYELWQNTFGLSGNNPFQRDGKFQLLLADNFPDAATSTLYTGDLSFKAVNNLIFGNQEEEIGFGERKGSNPFDTVFLHNAIRTKSAGYFAGTSSKQKGNIRLGSDFRFLNPFRYNFAPDTSGSQNRVAGSLPSQNQVSGILGPPEIFRSFLDLDIGGKPRTLTNTLIGAYVNQKK
jgi:hypothetical protein